MIVAFDRKMKDVNIKLSSLSSKISILNKSKQNGNFHVKQRGNISTARVLKKRCFHEQASKLLEQIQKTKINYSRISMNNQKLKLHKRNY